MSTHTCKINTHSGRYRYPGFG